MSEVFEQLEGLQKNEKRVAMATLVATKGTTPKKEGAKMWVGEGGRILGSVTIGGCVDAQVIEESEAVLASLKPKRLAMALGDEEAWELGLSCGGTVEVFIEPINLDNPDDPMVKVYETIRGEVEKGRPAVAVTPLEATSAKLVVLQDGTTIGTLGDDALDREARMRALELIQQRASRTLTLHREPAPLEAFFEVHGPPPTLIIFGAGHVAMPLVTLAKGLGLKTVVVDGRPRFATRDRFPDADELLIGIPSEIAETLSYTPSTFVVLVAHDYKYDIPVLKTVLKTDAVYIGMLGSRRRGQAILDFLREEGIGDDLLRRIHVPIGLDIGAKTAAEIALGILAEAICVKAGRPGTPMRERKSS
ncbi:MAG: XdhC family protein [candidate division NC10 bacterium]|nr:XdhC family protein [candidate division NC10 bacterium]